MELDELLRLAALCPPSEVELANVRRTARRISQEHGRVRAEGRDLMEDLDWADPLAAETDELRRVLRAAQVAKLGTFTWFASTGELTWSPELSLIFGQPPGPHHLAEGSLYDYFHPDDVAAFQQILDHAWSKQEPAQTSFRIIRADQVIRHVAAHLQIVSDRFGVSIGVVGEVEDVTHHHVANRERQRRQRRDRTVAVPGNDRDAGTGLLNRRRFIDEIDQAAAVGSGALLVLAVEPASFTTITEPAEQDQVATVVAAVLADATRRTDICALTAAGEFAVLMPRTSMRVAQANATKIVGRLREQHLVLGRQRLRLTVRGGMVRYDELTRTTGFDLLLDAENEWRTAAPAGQPLSVRYEPVPESQRQINARDRVRAAVAEDRFTLYAQPILDLHLNQVTRHEILLRVLDGTRCPAPPSAFLDMAERIDEMLPVDRWVVERALRTIGDGPQTAHYQINLSGRTLGDLTLLGRIDEAVTRLGVRPEQLTFEITETALIGNLTTARRFAEGIKEIGCQLALDDFGAGYGSFTYLKYFPIDLVKIDGGFVRGIDTSDTDRALVRSLLLVCHELGIMTAAEYVETDAVLEVLRVLGVDYAQGHLVGVPQPIGRAVAVTERARTAGNFANPPLSAAGSGPTIAISVNAGAAGRLALPG
jgi:EAL domain-containing protein (putative c-di-GMP-specific phosphodiesterase class I)/GGDEF domain-containing protein/PAS domain-containing protein